MIWAAPHPLCPTSKGPHYMAGKVNQLPGGPYPFPFPPYPFPYYTARREDWLIRGKGWEPRYRHPSPSPTIPSGGMIDRYGGRDRGAAWVSYAPLSLPFHTHTHPRTYPRLHEREPAQSHWPAGQAWVWVCVSVVGGPITPSWPACACVWAWLAQGKPAATTPIPASLRTKDSLRWEAGGDGKGWEPRYRHPSPSPCPSNQENLLKIPGIFLVPWDGKTGLSL